EEGFMSKCKGLTGGVAAALALLAIVGLPAFAETQVEDFDDGTLDGVWRSGNFFGGAQANSIVIDGGVLTFTKTGAAAASTESIGLADGVVDNRFPAPWTVEFTIPDATDFVADGAYLVARFWKPGVPLADWVAVA